jgi:hypothetical protein
VVFGLNPVGQLVITNGEDGVRLLLSVVGPVAEDIMVFGQAPCSAGRTKRRNVSYLGLLPVPQDGLSDVTELYVARFGEPRPGEKVFIVTCQQKDGWEGFDKETSEIVPDKPAGQQAVSTVALTLQSLMHKGCTRDAQGISSQAVPEAQASGEEARLGYPKAGTRNPKEIRNPSTLRSSATEDGKSEHGLAGWAAVFAAAAGAQGMPKEVTSEQFRSITLAVPLGQGMRKGRCRDWAGVEGVRAGRRRSEWPLA